MNAFAFFSLAVALIVERFLGYPDFAYRRIGHPVEWIGKAIGELEHRLNDPQVKPLEAKLRGALTLFVVVAAAAAAAWALERILLWLPLGNWLVGLAAIPFLAQKSLRDHARAVARGFDWSLETARAAVAQIVGRDASRLDESGISNAALESLAENASDGVVAPAFWFALLGLPGLAAYKAINTADSMIGHRTTRYRDFGWAAARLDDLVNLPASRLTGLLFAATAALGDKQHGKAALQAMWRDASRHVSPNAGWPEAALAGALDIRLGGPRHKDGELVDLARMGNGRAELTRDDIRRGLRLYGRALWLLFALVAMAAVLL
jgi:adenosylcobinamide-phosphate synthase